jgi:hypothetical protein
MDMEVVYNAALEREAIRAQQIRSEPKPKAAPTPGAGAKITTRMWSLRQTCLALLQSRPTTWMSAADVAAKLGEEPRRVHYTLGGLVGSGLVVRERVMAGHRRAVQRYRINR